MAKHHQYTVMDERQLAMPRAMRRKVNPPRRHQGYEELIAAQRHRADKLQQAHDLATVRRLNKAAVRQAEIQRRSQP